MLMALLPFLRGTNANTFGNLDGRMPRKVNKKTDVADHPEVTDHVGLLFIELPGARAAIQLVFRQLLMKCIAWIAKYKPNGCGDKLSSG